MYILYHCCNAVGVISVLMFLSIKANHALKRAGPNVTCARYGLTHWTLNYGNAQGIVNCGSIGIIMGEMRVGNALLRWAMEPVVSVLNLVMVNIFDRMSMILNALNMLINLSSFIVYIKPQVLIRRQQYQQ